ncbi:hypothetical protein [Sphingobacterium lumbrici]|uniref:hypothetical protein n=1 Tax=Sphingobacterium lumbrici TaxID=2559600 RepID=UPI0015E2BEAD|nr:hypothetical protein [Sphingobacterium lumbrici]
MGTREYLLEKAKSEERARAEAEKLEAALEFKKLGVSDSDIAKALGLTVDQVKAL